MLRPNAFRIFRARPVSYGTTERPMALQSQRDCILQPRVAESARLPWEEGSLAVNPNGVAASGEARWSQPLWGRGLRTMFTQGSSRLATLGFGAESLWDSALLTPQGMGSNPSGIGQECPRSYAAWNSCAACRTTSTIAVQNISLLCAFCAFSRLFSFPLCRLCCGLISNSINSPYVDGHTVTVPRAKLLGQLQSRGGGTMFY